MSNYKSSTFCIQGLSPEFCKWMVDQGLGHYGTPELIDQPIDELRLKKMDFSFMFNNNMIKSKLLEK